MVEETKGNLDLFNELASSSVKAAEDQRRPVPVREDVVSPTEEERKLAEEWLSVHNDALFEEIASWQIC